MRLNFLLVLLLVLTASCRSDKSDKSFQDDQGGFKVGFVQEPALSIDTFQTELGQVELHAYLLELSTNHAQMLTYSDYPIGPQYIKDPYGFIDGAKVGALKSLGISVLDMDERITFMGVPGVEVKGHNGQGLRIHYKLFLRDTRLYQLGVLSEGQDEHDSAGEKFMESFEFINIQ